MKNLTKKITICNGFKKYAYSKVFKFRAMKRHKYEVVSSSLNTDKLIYEVLDLSDIKVKIPMIGKTESLNAAVATSIILYEYVRQKLQ